MKFKFFILLVVLFSVSLLNAATWDQTKGVGLRYSVIKFAGDIVDQSALGNVTGLQVKYGLSPYVMLALDAGYGGFKPAEPGSDWKKDENSPYRTFLFPVNLVARVTPFKDGKFKPYAQLGAGALFWDLRNVGGTDKSFWGDQQFRWGSRISGFRKNAVLSQGIGAEYFFTDYLSLDVLASFSTILQMKNDNVGRDDVNDQIIAGTAALTYYWGYYKDTDGDGIQDKYDLDPTHAEDFDGFQDNDGRPDPDNDNDGIPDIVDKAPLQPEDMDGFQDEDGVPDPDNDGDGIADVDDKCPNEPEDMDGFQDEDGCPDLDNDGDGIVDAKDACPNEPETMNGYQDDDGCPDTKPIPQLEKAGAKLVMEGVNFGSGSASLTSESFAILDKVVEGLKDNPEVNIEVRGYTDSQGRASTNQQLSEKRAQTVMNYLINVGIDASRLRAVGYGEEDPIADNNTAAGRAKNRRIEFVRTN